MKSLIQVKQPIRSWWQSRRRIEDIPLRIFKYTNNLQRRNLARRTLHLSLYRNIVDLTKCDSSPNRRQLRRRCLSAPPNLRPTPILRKQKTRH